MTPNDGLKILEMLLNGGVVNVLMAMIALVVLAFIGFVGVIAWLAITQAPKFNEHLGDITASLREGSSMINTRFEKLETKVDTIHSLVSIRA